MKSHASMMPLLLRVFKNSCASEAGIKATSATTDNDPLAMLLQILHQCIVKTSWGVLSALIRREISFNPYWMK